jgi:hypothetical protein
MSVVAKFILVLITAASLQDAGCRVDGGHLLQLLQKIYSLSQQQGRAVSRRNIADLSTIPGTRIFQEPSSRDLDVDFAVGIKDDGNDSDLQINNRPLKTSYFPTSVSSTSQPYLGSNAVDEPSSKELNIGVFVDPKNGVSYYSPGYAPSTGFSVKPGVDDRLQEGYDPLVHSVGQSDPGITSSVYPAVLQSYQQSRLTNPSNSGPYSAYNPITNYLRNSIDRVYNLNRLPYPYETHPKLIPGTGINSQFVPLEGYSENTAEMKSNLDQRQNAIYPYHGVYQQPFRVADKVSYNPTPFNDISNQWPETLYQQPMTANALDFMTYPQIYRPVSSARPYQKIYGRVPYHLADVRYSSPSSNMQNVFRVEEQVPEESYRYPTEPVVVRHERGQPRVILDQQGKPVISAQPYGTRQVGTFRLRNDHGYQVLVSHYGILIHHLNTTSRMDDLF